jgi:hypothetical protein
MTTAKAVGRGKHRVVEEQDNQELAGIHPQVTLQSLMKVVKDVIRKVRRNLML